MDGYPSPARRNLARRRPSAATLNGVWPAGDRTPILEVGAGFALRRPTETFSMIVMRHHQTHNGWVYSAASANIEGGGRTLEGSMDASEHSARHHLSAVHGYAVEHEDARAQVRHTIDGEQSADAPATPVLLAGLAT